MHRQLPAELNLHVLSFLSSKEIIKTKQVDKKSNLAAKDPQVWQDVLEKDFFIKKCNQSKMPESEYKNLSLELKNELEWRGEVFEAYLFSLEIKRNILNGSLSDPFDRFRSTPLTLDDRVINQNHQVLVWSDKLNAALLHSKELIKQEFKKMIASFPDTFISKTQVLAKKILESNEGFIEYMLTLPPIDQARSVLYYLTSIAKSNAYVLTQMLVNKLDFSPDDLGMLLHTACLFLNVETAQVLIEAKANINCLQQHTDWLGYFSEITPLFAAIRTLRTQRIYNPQQSIEPAMQLIHLLIKNGADPCAKIILQRDEDDRHAPMPEPGSEEYEQQKISIKELCIMEKERPEHYTPVEVLDLIINAAPPEEKNLHKRPRLR